MGLFVCTGCGMPELIIRIKGFSQILGRDDNIKDPSLINTLKLWDHVSLYIRAPRILSVFQLKESSPVAFPALWLTWIRVKSNRRAPLTNMWSLEKSLLTSSWRCCQRRRKMLQYSLRCEYLKNFFLTPCDLSIHNLCLLLGQSSRRKKGSVRIPSNL